MCSTQDDSGGGDRWKKVKPRVVRLLELIGPFVPLAVLLLDRRA
ncbi:hypothetical protein [Streptomyces sp. NPDC086023]